jgi:penicillin-binding protein 1A
MKRLLAAAASAVALLFTSAVSLAQAVTGDAGAFWDLPPLHLRQLVSAPQVMITRTATGWDAYCRCPVVLKPHEIPEVMKKAIIAVEDKRYLDHGGIDLIALMSVLRGGLSRGGSTIPMQLMKNLVLHDLQQRDLLSKLERKGAEIWHAATFDGAVNKQQLLAAYLNQIEFGGREIVGLSFGLLRINLPPPMPPFSYYLLSYFLLLTFFFLLTYFTAFPTTFLLYYFFT